jgi:hypothetical protein
MLNYLGIRKKTDQKKKPQFSEALSRLSRKFEPWRNLANGTLVAGEGLEPPTPGL